MTKKNLNNNKMVNLNEYRKTKDIKWLLNKEQLTIEEVEVLNDILQDDKIRKMLEGRLKV